MKAFPFSEAEWATVREAALGVTNGALANDPVVQASHVFSLRRILAQLRGRYGDHPVLLETEADFADDDVERVSLYRQAIETATAHRMPTLSIRMSLARVLLEGDQASQAMAELSACAGELAQADAAERSEWAELQFAATRLASEAHPDGDLG